jgi:hypothetical protein
MSKPEPCINQTIQGFGLYRILVYSGFWFIQGFGLYRMLVYSVFGLYRILVYTWVWFIQDSTILYNPKPE